MCRTPDLKMSDCGVIENPMGGSEDDGHSKVRIMTKRKLVTIL